MRISDWSSDVCSSDLRRACVAAAVVAPAGLADDVAQLVGEPRRRPHVLGDPHPFVKRRPEPVEATEILDDAVAGLAVVALGLARAEPFVPDNEPPGIILVELTRVGRVGCPGVTRGV